MECGAIDLDFPANATDSRDVRSSGCNDDDVIRGPALLLWVLLLRLGEVLAVSILVTDEFAVVACHVDEIAHLRPVPSSAAKAGRRGIPCTIDSGGSHIHY